MQTESFALFQSLLKERSGLVVAQDNAYLLESRLMPVARNWTVKGLDDLAAMIRAKPDERLLTQITEAMTTSETSFLRDGKPFEQFRSVLLPELLQRRASERTLRIWCAGASTGQEPYSLAMILTEERECLKDWSVEILATDLSTESLARAEAGVYTHFEIQRGLPVTYLVRHFTATDDRWTLSDEVRQMVRFQPFNLLDDMTPLGRFDIVLCRNVLTYLDRPGQADVLARLAAAMHADGYLILGSMETVIGITDRFTPIKDQRGLFAVHATDSAASKEAAAG